MGRPTVSRLFTVSITLLVAACAEPRDKRPQEPPFPDPDTPLETEVAPVETDAPAETDAPPADTAEVDTAGTDLPDTDTIVPDTDTDLPDTDTDTDPPDTDTDTDLPDTDTDTDTDPPDTDTDTDTDTDPPDTDTDTDTDLPDTFTAPPALPCPAGVAAYRVRGTGAPTSYKSVNAALGASAPNDEIVVCPGTWTTSHTLAHAGPLLLRSNDNDPTTTALTGGGTQRILALATGADLRVEGLTFRQGFHATGGSAIYGTSVADVDVRRCAFVNNVADYQGGALYLSPRLPSSGGGVIRVAHSTFTNNDADYEGGAISIGGLQTVLDVELRDLRITGSDAGYEGGALSFLAYGGTIALHDVVIEDATASYQHAAIEFDRSSLPGAAAVTATWTGGALRRATSPRTGAVWVDSGVRLTVTDVDLDATPGSNTPVDINGCAGNYGVVATFRVEPSAGVYCQ